MLTAEGNIFDFSNGNIPRYIFLKKRMRLSFEQPHFETISRHSARLG